MGTYPENWPEIAQKLKFKHNQRRKRCNHINERETGYVLTVHHLDGNKTNCAEWNLAILCQRCHLHIQAKVKFEQLTLPGFKHSDWFKPHLEGYLLSKKELPNEQ